MDKMNSRSESGATSFYEPSEEEIVAVRLFDAPRRRVWDAITRPEHIAQWMTLGEGSSLLVCEIDLRPAGQWHILWRKADGSQFRMRGTYGHVAPGQRLVTTESWGAGWPETLNVRELFDDGTKTKLTSTTLYPSREARDKAISSGLKVQWSHSFERLDQYLSTFAKQARRAG